MQAGVLLDVAADDGNFQTRERFAGRAESAVVARGAIFPAAVHALGTRVQGAMFARARGGLREGAGEVARGCSQSLLNPPHAGSPQELKVV